MRYKELITDQSLDRDELVFRTRLPITWYFALLICLLLAVGVQFAEPKIVAKTTTPWFLGIAAISFILANRRSTLQWNKWNRTAVLRKSIVGIERKHTYSFDDADAEVNFVNMFEPNNHNRNIDRNWFTLKIGRNLFLIPSEIPAKKENLPRFRKQIGLI